MILWFSEGNYIIKALDLKSQMGTLTEKEKKKYEDQLMPVLAKREAEEKAEEASAEEEKSGEESAGEETEPKEETEEKPEEASDEKPE